MTMSKQDARFTLRVMAVAFLLITALAGWSIWMEVQQNQQCRDLGGEYVSARGAALCVKDGLIVKTYQ